MSDATTADERISIEASLFLRRALLADAGMTGAAGLLMLLGADMLAGLLGLPASLLRYAGAALIPFVAFVAYVGTRTLLSPMAVWTVITCNALWAAGSLLLLAWLTPTVLGYVFVVAQATAVAVFGELQFIGLRRSAAR
jgi:hypothetical protein